MNPDDQNQPPAQQTPPTPGDQVPPVSPPPQEPGEPTPVEEAPQQPPSGAEEPIGVGGTPAGQPGTTENCHCGRTLAGSNCTGCNVPAAGCQCPPTA